MARALNQEIKINKIYPHFDQLRFVRETSMQIVKGIGYPHIYGIRDAHVVGYGVIDYDDWHPTRQVVRVWYLSVCADDEIIDGLDGAYAPGYSVNPLSIVPGQLASLQLDPNWVEAPGLREALRREQYLARQHWQPTAITLDNAQRPTAVMRAI